jgi:4-diphosphocytidyl-2-C-methyl-D-erythritol kinase
MSTAAETQPGASQSTDSSTLTLFSPCKINLFLRILRKRADGYHDLASLFQAVGFGDTLELTPIQEGGEKDEFTCNMPGVPVDSSNLVLRALQLMRQKTGCTDQFFRANLIKQCPAQAGLGGGSANAATAMWGANQLMGEPATLEQVRCAPVVVSCLLSNAVAWSALTSLLCPSLDGRMVSRIR